jgi:hypothetical protein
MSGACRTHGRDEKFVVFWLENLKGRDHSEDMDIDGRIILGWVLRKQGGKVWTGFVWLRIRATVMNLWVPQKAGNILIS